MGRVKDNIVRSPPDQWAGLKPVALVTRDMGGRARSLWLVLRAVAAIVRGRIDGSLALVHINMGDKGSAVRKGVLVLVARLVGVPVFLHLHAVTLERDIARLPRWVQPLLLLPFRVATCVIVLGDRWRRWLRDEAGITRTPIELLWNGVPILPTKRDHVDGDGPLRILFLGALLERKGMSDLIAALGQVPQTGRGWQAHFAGTGDIPLYTRKAEQAGVADLIGFTGWVGQDTAQALTAAADLLVLPSYDEGLPLVVLEALGLGTPVITTPVGAVPEVLTDGHDVIFTPPGDPSALAAAITRVLGDDVLRQSLCNNGLATFQRLFSIGAFRSSLLAIWERHAPRRR